MRKLLLITTALVALAGPARAEPISTGINLLWLNAGAALGGSVWANAVLQLGASVLLSAVARALSGKPRTEETRAQIARPTSLPPYRFAYGRGWIPGTPVIWVVKGRILYACYLMNSRPSALSTHKLILDKREVDISGDPFDFAGPGAAGTNDLFSGHVRYWLGRGDQTTAPAAVVSGSGGEIATTDAWRGCTVLWLALDCGDQGKRSERWPASPPAVNLDGDWSLVWDPRDADQDPADPASWGWSNNPALVCLDALLCNPLRAYSLAYLLPETFAWAADVADQRIGVVGGATIPRYRADGLLVFSEGAELEDQIGPLLDAGASRLIRVGGRLGIVPACARAAVYTVTDLLDDQAAEFIRWQSSDQIVTEALAQYVAPDRAYETAESPLYTVPGALAEDGGVPKRGVYDLDFVQDHRQGQRLAKIMAQRTRYQRQISAVLPPEAFDLVAGSAVEVDLPAPYDRWNGLYEVEQIAPAVAEESDEGVALRCPVVLRQSSAAIYAWDHATEEQAVAPASFDASRATLAKPIGLALLSDDTTTLTVGDTIMPRVRVTVTPAVGSSATHYDWEWRPLGGAWASGGSIDAAVSPLIGWLDAVEVGSNYEIRVRAATQLRRSDWVNGTVFAAAGASPLPPPTSVGAMGLRTQIISIWRAPNAPAYSGMQIWMNVIDDLGTASLATTIYHAANSEAEHVVWDLPPNTARYFWARTIDTATRISAFSEMQTGVTESEP